MSKSAEDKVRQIIIANTRVDVETVNHHRHYVNPGKSLADDLGFDNFEIARLAAPISWALGVDLPLGRLPIKKIRHMTVGQLMHAATTLTGVVSLNELERALDEIGESTSR